MSLNVRLTLGPLGEKPHFTVSGPTIEAQLGAVLSGRDDLIECGKPCLGHGAPDGMHLSDHDGLAAVFELGLTSGRIKAPETYARRFTGGAFVPCGQTKGATVSGRCPWPTCMTETARTSGSGRPCAWTSARRPAPRNATSSPTN